MEKELHNHPFSLSPSICQPFVLSPSFLRHDSGQAPLRTGVSKPVVSSVEPDTVDILKTGLSKADLRMVRQAHHERTEDSHALDYPCGPTGTTPQERWALLELGFPLKARACEIFLTQNILQDIKDE